MSINKIKESRSSVYGVLGESMLTKKEWIDFTSSIWNGCGWKYSLDEHPATFPIQIPLRLIKMFSFVGEIVLDPFCGIGTSLFAAKKLKRIPIGIELSKKYVATIKSKDPQIPVFNCDARHIPLRNNSVHFIIFSPPYWDAVNYECDKRYDIGRQQPHQQYLREMSEVFAECHRVLKPGRKMAIVIGDSHRRNREYAHHAYFITICEQNGWVLNGTWIYIKMNNRTAKPYGSYLRPYKIYPYHMHEYILIFEKTKN